MQHIICCANNGCCTFLVKGLRPLTKALEQAWPLVKLRGLRPLLLNIKGQGPLANRALWARRPRGPAAINLCVASKACSAKLLLNSTPLEAAVAPFGVEIYILCVAGAAPFGAGIHCFCCSNWSTLKPAGGPSEGAFPSSLLVILLGLAADSAAESCFYFCRESSFILLI